MAEWDTSRCLISGSEALVPTGESDGGTEVHQLPGERQEKAEGG